MFLIVKFGQRSGLLRDAVRDGDSQTFVTLRLQHIGVILCYTEQPGKESTDR